MKMAPVKVLDAYAVMTFFYDEPGADAVHRLLVSAGEGEISLLLSAVNAGEVWYWISRGSSLDAADQYLQELEAIGVKIVDVDWGLTRQAAVYKVKGNISYADCFAAALAKSCDCPLVTGDKEFKQLEREIMIEWVS